MNKNIALKKKVPILLSAILILAAIIIAVFIGVRINRINGSLDLGRQYLNELDYKAALITFEGVLQIDNRNAEAAIEIAGIYSIWGMYEEALTVVDEVLTRKPDDRLTALADELKEQIPTPDDIIEIRDASLADLLGRTFQISPDMITQRDLDRITEITYAGYMWPPISITLDDGTQIGEILLDADGNVLEDYDYEHAVTSCMADLNPDTAAVFARCRNADILFMQFSPGADFTVDDLAKLKNLKHLSLFASFIDSFAFIPTLPRLETLELCQCESDDYSDIFVSPSLKSLQIEAEDEFGLEDEYAAVIDLTGLSRMTELQALTLLSDGEIIGYPEIASLTALKSLEIGIPENGDLSFLTPLSALESLEIIGASGMTLDITPLTGKTLLKTFVCTGAQYTDIAPFGTLTSLQTLNLADMGLTDISALAGMTGLEYLRLSDNDITDISALSTMPNLYWVELERNRISDLSPLSDKAQLNQLRLTDNAVTDLSGLKNLPNLEYLFVTGNPIASVAPLSSLQALADLRIDEAAIDDHAHIAHVKSVNRQNDYWGGSPFK